MTIGERVKKIRTYNKLTQKEFGDIIGASKTSVSTYESGGREMSLDVLIKMCKYFRVSADYILGISEVVSYDLNEYDTVLGADVDLVRAVKENNAVYVAIKKSPYKIIDILSKEIK